MKETFIENGIEYVRNGGYYIQNLKAPKGTYNISNAKLHLMFDRIIIEKTDEGLNLDHRLKSPFISKTKES